MTVDRLGVAMFEARGRTLPPDLTVEPRYRLRCADGGELLGSVYSTSVGALYWWDQPRVRCLSSDGAAHKHTQGHVGFVEELPEGMQVLCGQHGWRLVPTRERLAALLYDTPKGGVVPLDRAPGAVPSA